MLAAVPVKKNSGKMAVMLEDWDRELEESDQVVVSHEVDRYLLDPMKSPQKDQSLRFWIGGSLMVESTLVCKQLPKMYWQYKFQQLLEVSA